MRKYSLSSSYPIPHNPMKPIFLVSAFDLGRALVVADICPRQCIDDHDSVFSFADGGDSDRYFVKPTSVSGQWKEIMSSDICILIRSEKKYKRFVLPQAKVVVELRS